MEDGIQEALECCDHGYECDNETLFSETVQTTKPSGAPFASANLSYQQIITADEIVADVDGTTYVLPRTSNGFGETDAGGMPILTNFPIYIGNYEWNGTIYSFVNTQNAETISLTVSVETIEASDCLEKVIKKYSLKNIADDGSGIVEGNVGNNDASGGYSHAEGSQTTASGATSHAEGHGTVASSTGSHAEGQNTTASGMDSHAEGDQTTASGQYSHAEGYEATASGSGSHAEGTYTMASGKVSHAQNHFTIAQGYAQTAIGEFNVAQGSNGNSHVATDYAFIIGNGTANNARHNALAIKWDGTFVFANGTEITPAQFASLLALL